MSQLLELLLWLPRLSHSCWGFTRFFFSIYRLIWNLLMSNMYQVPSQGPSYVRTYSSRFIQKCRYLPKKTFILNCRIQKPNFEPNWYPKHIKSDLCTNVNQKRSVFPRQKNHIWFLEIYSFFKFGKLFNIKIKHQGFPDLQKGRKN